MRPDERIDHARLDVVHVRVRAPAVAVDAHRRDRIVVDEARRSEQVVVVLREVNEALIRADRDPLEPANVLEVDLPLERVTIVRGRAQPVVVSRERRRDPGAVAVIAVLDRPGIPHAASAGPGELPREDAHVHVPHDLAAAHVRRVVDVAPRDRGGRVAERSAIVVEPGVRHADHLAARIEAVLPVPIVPGPVRERAVRLDDPIGLRVERVHWLDDVDELDGGEVREQSEEDGGDLRAHPAEVALAERAPDAVVAAEDVVMAEPCLDPLGRVAGEHDDPDVHGAGGRHAGLQLPGGIERTHPVDERERR